MKKEIYSNWPYILWFVFYFLLFWSILGGTAKILGFLLIVYSVSLVIAFSPISESLYRSLTGARRLLTKAEKDRLLPLFIEVYLKATKIEPYLPRNIYPYIQENWDMNAFAFGQGTLALTRGSINLLSDDCLKGMIAHELGHFAHFDTAMLLIAAIGNLLMSILMIIIQGIANVLYQIAQNIDPILGTCFKGMYWVVNGTYRFIQFIGDVILMSVSREHEYMADSFAHDCGYGKELTTALYQIYQVSISNRGSIIEQLRSTHPPLPERISRLERLSDKLIE